MKAATVKYQRNIPNMNSRMLRALLHRAWIHGNESYHLPHEKEGSEERHDMIDELLIEHGFAKLTK